MKKAEDQSAAAVVPAGMRISPRFLDFWLMGGLSLVAWAVISAGQLIRGDYNFVGQRFEQVGATFALLSIICNHPHFIASYRMAYGRGWDFCRQHWFALLLMPALLFLLFLTAFLNLEAEVAFAPWIVPFNWAFAQSGIGFRFGNSRNFGLEMIGASVWLMYLTVGWHYAKQVFGCMLVYAHYDGYSVSAFQRRVLKFALYSVSFYSFCQIAMHWRDFYPGGGAFSFLGAPVGELGLPAFLDQVGLAWLVAGIGAFLGFVVVGNFRKLAKLPSANFLVPFVAFYAWWVPFTHHPEFYLMMVPFFHSLQYLPFAYRMELQGQKSERRFALRLLVLLGAGFLAFEAVPGLLDTALGSSLGNIPYFFTIAFAVFINVHHFFIDSVLWRFQDGAVREALLSPTDERHIRGD